MNPRQQLLKQIAQHLSMLHPERVLRIGIDGVDGAGKTTFADELAQILTPASRPVIRASVDGFHNPTALRYRQGRHSAAGFFADSYNYAGLKQVLLEPLSPGGNAPYATAIFDLQNNTLLEVQFRQLQPRAILLFDGIFLHRPELRDYWDFSIFLAVDFTVSIPRGARRGNGSADLSDPANQRYIGGQQIYLQNCQPQQYATLIIDNHDLNAPFVVSSKVPGFS